MRAVQLRALADYNQAMNRKVYKIVADLNDGQRQADRRAFFGSIHATLNHILLVDRLWVGRITGAPPVFDRLDQELYGEFHELSSAQSEMDGITGQWANSVSDDELLEQFHYSDMAGVARRCPLWVAATQLFNHQTHHRGQLTQMLSECGLDVGVTDFPFVVEGLVTRL